MVMKLTNVKTQKNLILCHGVLKLGRCAINSRVGLEKKGFPPKKEFDSVDRRILICCKEILFS